MRAQRSEAIAAGHERHARQAEFDAKFAAQDDPWRYRSSWYEARKRALLLAALPRQRYRRAFEPGCANGALSAELAQRCETLLSSDFAPRAVALARRRLAPFAQARVETRAMPDDWPEARFDLIVISEFGYYLDEPACAALARLACASLEHDGTLACCHWRHGADDMRIGGGAVHARFAQAARRAALEVVAHVDDADFLLDVWSAEPASLARREQRRGDAADR
ncbi:SAM-dependent methyltransferase [Burkholderia gladioli]|uniref:SAM-dependent methyltransferase n=1 Tax=Burkholderia gladioli TaxID=28095 RepID=UPI0022D1ADDD|nr:SAM-dependent methyltransferase [Burkholderia gladioli]MDA0570362.1 nodulation S family protein [Burkholderia gladioli]MDA0598578.1 nodulation S family protein [Burkholderia gladioli]